MKRVLLVFLVLSVGFLAGYLCHQWSGSTARADELLRWTPNLNGDVNGDGSLNLTDAIFLLNFCFRAGEPPVPLPKRGLPVTGQVHCWSDVSY